MKLSKRYNIHSGMAVGSKPVRRLKRGAVPSVFSYSHCMQRNAEDSGVSAAKRLKTVQKLEVGRV